MLCQVTILFILHLTLASSPQYFGSIYLNPYTLAPIDEKEVERLAHKMLNEIDVVVGLVGYQFTQNDDPQKYAKALKNYIIGKYNIPPERIITSGRAELKQTQDKVAVDAFTLPPEAIVYKFKNKVFIQPTFIMPNWVPARENFRLYRLYRVSTGKKSYTIILFPELGSLKIGEDAITIIYGIPTEAEGKKERIRDIELKRGTLRAMLDRMSKDDEVNVKTPIAVVNLKSKSNKIALSPKDLKLRGLISIYEGKAEVSAQGRKVKVKEDYGTIVEEGKPPSPPRPLPPPPRFIFPEDGYIVYGTSVTFRWKPTSYAAHIECSRSPNFEDITFDVVVEEADTLSAELEPGLHYCRISSIDKDGLEGRFSSPLNFTIVIEPAGSGEISQIEPKAMRQQVNIFLEHYEKGEVIVIGEAPPDIQVFIDGKQIDISPMGKFRYPVTYKTNTIYVKAIDPKTGAEESWEFPVPSGIKPKTSVEWHIGSIISPLFGFPYTALKIKFPKVFDILGAHAELSANFANAEYNKEQYSSILISVSIGLNKHFHFGKLIYGISLSSGIGWWRNLSDREYFARSDGLGNFVANISGDFGYTISKFIYPKIFFKAGYLHKKADLLAFGTSKSNLFGIIGMGMEIYP